MQTLLMLNYVSSLNPHYRNTFTLGDSSPTEPRERLTEILVVFWFFFKHRLMFKVVFSSLINRNSPGWRTHLLMVWRLWLVQTGTALLFTHRQKEERRGSISTTSHTVFILLLFGHTSVCVLCPFIVRRGF